LEGLDLKDKKILYYLEQDSRQSMRTIGKKVGLSKDVVSNRIKNLEKKEVIFNYYTVVNTFKLDFNVLRFYIKLQYVTSDKKQEIIDYFLKNLYVNVVVAIEGSYDLIVIFSMKDLNEIYFYWEKTLDKFRDYFESYNFSLYYKEILYDYKFLLDEKINEDDRKKMIMSSTKEKIDIDKLDYEILSIIAPNARIPTIEIADKLKTTTSVIHYRIKKLTDLKLILGYRTTINLSKFGLKLVKCFLFLKENKNIDKIMRYVEKNPFLHARDISIGSADIELLFRIKDISSLHTIVQDLSNKFPGVIKNYKYFSDFCIYKYVYIPKNF
jgi:Lrp/AsnC family transcriptional regulator for asnA, asnC and gidA